MDRELCLTAMTPSCNATLPASRALCFSPHHSNLFRVRRRSFSFSSVNMRGARSGPMGSLPKDPDPTWSGYAIGHWEGDYTLVVESAGFNDKTWLGATGYPHSEDMRVTERYQRVDRNTILYNIRVDDPKAYTKPIIGPERMMKLRSGVEIGELPCVWSEENSFTKRIREPAVGKPNR